MKVIIFSRDMKAISKIESDNRGRTYIKVKCAVCGVERSAYLNALKNGKGIRHGQACSAALNDGTELFKKFNSVYKGINRRVNNENFKYFKYYGARGIKNEFFSFPHFYFTTYRSYRRAVKKHGKVDLDRRKNKGNYSPINCRWVTHKVNMGNRGRSKSQKDFIAVSPAGKIHIGFHQQKFSIKHGLNYKEVWKCLNGKRKIYMGWTFKFKN